MPPRVRIDRGFHRMIGYVIVLAMLGCAMIAILVALSLDDRAPHQAPAADAKDGGG